jgi:hypothetical protein
MTPENGNIVRGGTGTARPYGSQSGGGSQAANLGDILERVLDTGIVIAGDIRVNLLDIELLTIKLRLVIASVDTARQLGIDWWQTDPWLSSKNRESPGGHDLAEENRQLRARLEEVERTQIDGARTVQAEAEPLDAGRADTDD